MSKDIGFQVESRLSDSPFVERVMRGHTIGCGSTIRPAEIHWHMVLVNHPGGIQFIMTGPLTTSGEVLFREGIELLWIKFRLGTFMPHLPTVSLRDTETALPDVNRQSFWLNGSAWELPTYDNADTFVDHLVHEEVLAFDPLISTVLDGRKHELAPRTIRYRFLQATGLTQNQIFQVERAQQAAELLQAGASILDTVEDAGYFDQPHLTRALKRWVGRTPAQIIQMSQTDCHFIQDAAPEIADNEIVT